MEKNKFKKQDANGNELPEAIGQGRNEIHIKLVLEARKEVNNDIYSFRISSKLKESFNELDNNGEVLRAFVRGYVAQRKNKEIL